MSIKEVYMKPFIKAALIRAVRTWAQAAIAAIGYGAATLGDVDWILVISTATLSAIISVLTSIITGLPEVDVLPPIEEEEE